MCVKKFLIITALFMTIFSTCNAAQVSIAYNVSAESFLAKMTQFLNSASVQKDCPLAITGLIRDEKSDMPNYNLKAWAALFAENMQSPPNGFVDFYVDTNNKLYSLKFTFKKDSNLQMRYLAVTGAACWALGMDVESTKQLLGGGESNNGIYTSSVGVPSLKRTFVLIMQEQGDMVAAVMIATDGRR